MGYYLHPGLRVEPDGLASESSSRVRILDYGFRYYSPELGRWINRDPIGEDAGVNIYGFLANDSVNDFDLLGMTSCSNCSGNPEAGNSSGIDVDPEWGNYELEGETCCEGEANLNNFQRDDSTSWGSISMGLIVEFDESEGEHKDLRIRWWTCFRPDGCAGYLKRCNDQKQCSFDTFWSPLPGYNSGPHVTQTRIQYLVCKNNKWTKKENRIGITYTNGLTGWKTRNPKGDAQRADISARK